jgi:hypothetical protein
MHLLCFPVGKMHYPARSGWISSPAGQGFMSTQRRENRRQRRSCMERRQVSDQIWFALLAWFVRAIATVGTAPPSVQASFHPSDKNLSPGTPARLATKSLQLGHRTTKLVRQDFCRTSCSSPPLRAARCAIVGIPTTRRLSLPLTPSPSNLERLHPSLPNNPAAKRRRTERYDGKGNLYFQHAA